ncbi:hypothetical protein GCM10010430_19620 [Kitasatospora cystarginea]|uniref:PepSY domain-containing protein n=1 Tax=Kitasatospora cystarginea TaxID=58350 RepID=A0ABN3DPQ8_9ACTN
MSQSVPPESFDSAETPATGEAATKASLRDRYLRLPKRRRPRLVALGAAVAVLGVAGVGAAAVVHHGMEHEGGRHGHFAAGHEHAGRDGEGKDGESKGGEGKGGGRSHGHDHGWTGQGGQDGAGRDGAGYGGEPADLAPAPLPAVPADQALAKAVAAVPGGKADTLRAVGQQGGGSAWAVEVLGPDGVRHLVTIDGAAGSVTGNTIVSPEAGSH